MEDRYRKNVAGVIINKDKKFLICKRIATDCWQFPQGGVDEGETYIDGLYREMNEEIGTSKFKAIATTHNLYSYEWPPHLKQRDEYIGQKQRYYLILFLGSDEDLKLDQREFSEYKWVNKEEILPSIEQVRIPIYTKVLEEFESYLKDL